MTQIYLYSFLIAYTVIVCIITLRMAVERDAGYYWFFGACVGFLLSVTFLGWIDILKPSAIDVYRGNTELQITYKGSVPVDTIVVFKEK